MLLWFCSAFGNKIIFFPQCVIKAEIYDSVNILEQRIVAMETNCNACKQSSYQPLWIHRGKETLFPFSHYQRLVSSICLCHTEISPQPQSHSTTQHQCMRGRRLHPEDRWQSHMARERCPDPPLHAICTAKIIILLSKYIWGFLSSVVWLTVPVSEGSALCTPNVKPRPDNCLSVAEWAASDVGGWKWAVGSAASGIREPCLACGIWLPQSKAAAAPQALTDTQLANAVRVQHDDTAWSTPAPQLESTPSSWLGGRRNADKLLHTT